MYTGIACNTSTHDDRNCQRSSFCCSAGRSSLCALRNRSGTGHRARRTEPRGLLVETPNAVKVAATGSLEPVCEPPGTVAWCLTGRPNRQALAIRHAWSVRGAVPMVPRRGPAMSASEFPAPCGRWRSDRCLPGLFGRRCLPRVSGVFLVWYGDSSTAQALRLGEMRCPGAVSSVKMRCRGWSRRERMGGFECSGI